jgi:hypothetical protein
MRPSAQIRAVSLPSPGLSPDRDEFIDQSPVENITVEHVFMLAKRLMASSKAQGGLIKRNEIDVFELPHGITVTVEGSWFEADIKLSGNLWSYHVSVRRGGVKGMPEGQVATRIIRRAGFLGHSSRFAEDFLSLMLTI